MCVCMSFMEGPMHIVGAGSVQKCTYSCRSHDHHRLRAAGRAFLGTELWQDNCRSGNCARAKGSSVFLIRYFIFVGGVLLALLFVADWYWPDLSPMSSYGTPIDEAIVRIRSEHKWPQKVELDTATPIIVPQSLRAEETAETAIPPANKPALNALAQANPPQKQVVKRKPPAHARYRSPNNGGGLRFAVNPMPSAWSIAW
jgi:hypothetical protein